MVAPVWTVTLNAVDITDDVHAPEGEWTIKYGRGASFDGSAEAPGYAIVRVANRNRKYNPYNSGSSLAASLRFGKRVHISAVSSAVTYHPFDGYLDRIVQDPTTGFAELHCIDMLGLAEHRATPIVTSDTRSLRDLRQLIIDGLGSTTVGDTETLGPGGGELFVGVTGADRRPTASWLEEINKATGSIHFARGRSGGYEYVSLDRTQLQSTAVAETWDDTDFALPFAETLGGLDYSAEGLVNRMQVEPSPRDVGPGWMELWSSPESITVAGTTSVGGPITRVFWAEGLTAATDMAYTVTDAGSCAITMTPYHGAAKFTITHGGGGTGTVVGLRLIGRPIQSHEIASEPVAEEEDTASQTTYNGVRSATLSSELIPSLAAAHGLASWYIYRYKDVRARPGVTMVNRLPSQFVRDIGDRVAVTSTELSMTASQFWIRTLETVVSDHGAVVTTDYGLEAAPALVNIVTIGGTAAQGVGGSAILGY